MLRFIVAFLVMILLPAGDLRAASCPPFSPGALAQVDLAVSLAGSAPILPRLPILLRVTVTNNSGASVDVPPLTPTARDEAFATLDLFTALGADAPLSVRLASPTFGPFKEGIEPAPPELLHLPPGASSFIDVPLSYDWDVDNPRSLVEAASLRVSAKLYGLADDEDGDCAVDPNVSAVSPELLIPVPTASGDDASALTAVLMLVKPWLLAHPTALFNVRLESDFAALQSIVSTYPTTLYALYAKAVLAFAHDLGDDLDSLPSRPPDPSTALALVDEVLSDTRFVLQPELLALRERIIIETTP